ncbi:MAG: hypothetical protein MI717_08515, partial [Spirochaetales bacterium]|nr:hypothetical protein [Spirochaetales bacterium]
MKIHLWAAASFLLLGILSYFLALPTLAFGYWGIPLILFIISALLVLFLGLSQVGLAPHLPYIVLASVAFLLLTLVPFLTTAPMFRSGAYRELLGDVQQKEFSESVAPVDASRIRLVDQSMAAKLGDKKIGEDPALGSIAELGTFAIQRYRGELYWVAPLVHRSFFKWISYREGSQGYVMVSATNPQDVRLVQSIAGENLHLRYQPQAYFGEDLKRHVYFGGHQRVGLADYSFEIDEDGQPFWVITRFEKAVGYGGREALGTVVVNAQTGEIQDYSLSETPAWVDRIQPEAFVRDQINDWGRFGKGWWNAIFAEEGVIQLTEGTSLVHGADGHSYWYSGLTSSGGDDSTVGFILVDTRTKEASFYRQSGATERAARRSAEGKVQEKGYVASFPVMYNVQGRPTYACALKDKTGLIKLVALVSVENFGVIGIGET